MMRRYLKLCGPASAALAGGNSGDASIKKTKTAATAATAALVETASHVETGAGKSCEEMSEEAKLMDGSEPSSTTVYSPPTYRSLKHSQTTYQLAKETFMQPPFDKWERGCAKYELFTTEGYD
jgi:hypothetical protein